MIDSGCFVRKIEFRSESTGPYSIDVNIPFNDIHRLHAILERAGYDNKCPHDSLIVAYDIRGNIISAISYNKNSSGVQPALSPSIAAHSKVWEDALDDLSEVLGPIKFPIFDEQVAKKLENSALASYKNGVHLLDDAELLFDNERLARSGALAILAFEEFSKSFILKTCLPLKRWDREIYLGLRDHAKKHAVLYGAIFIAPTINRLSYSPFGANVLPTSEIESVTKTFSDKKRLDKLKQSLQFSDVQKNGFCQQVSTNRQDVLIGLYLAKLAWYYLSFLHDGINQDHVQQIEKGTVLTWPCITTNVKTDNTMLLSAAKSICFRDSTICTVSYLYNVINEADSSTSNKTLLENCLYAVTERAEGILEGRTAPTSYGQEVRDFWQYNQKELDVCGQLKAEMGRLGYKYSPYLAAIKEAIG